MSSEIQALVEEMKKMQLQLQNLQSQRLEENQRFEDQDGKDEEMEDYEDEETWNDERGWEAVMPPTMIAAHSAHAQKLCFLLQSPHRSKNQATRSV